MIVSILVGISIFIKVWLTLKNIKDLLEVVKLILEIMEKVKSLTPKRKRPEKRKRKRN